MEGMLVRIEVVEHDLNNVKALEDEGVCVVAVDLRRGGCRARSNGGVERGNVGLDVTYIVDKCAVRDRLAKRDL